MFIESFTAPPPQLCVFPAVLAPSLADITVSFLSLLAPELLLLSPQNNNHLENTLFVKTLYMYSCLLKL